MVNNKRLRLQRDEIRRLKYLKYELLRILLKSIIHNEQIKPKFRAYAIYKLQKKNVYYSQQKNYCLLTARGRGVWKFWNISRHMINQYAKFGKLTNIKSNNEK